LIDFLKNIDTELFLYLNGKHNCFFDVLMYWTSKEWTWIPLYVLLFYLIYKSESGHTIHVLLSVAVLITISDQLSVHLFKNVFLRYRPTHHLLIGSLVHTVNGYRGGMYGFVSSHAANTFALATLIGLILRKHYRYITTYMFIWAGFVSYSRIYLGVHYPADVAAGALLGSGLAFLVYKLYIYLINRQRSI
jgi:undecaprenyl-diphosphatase